MEDEFRSCIRELRDEGRTVLLSSHILAEVEALCDDLTIVRAGRTVQAGSLTELRQLTVTWVIAEVDDVLDLAVIDGVKRIEVDGHRLRLDVDTRHLGELIGALSQAGLRSLISQPPTWKNCSDQQRQRARSRRMIQLAGTSLLVRQVVHRDRRRLARWVVAITALIVAGASGSRQQR